MKRLLATVTLIAFFISITPNSYAAIPKAGAKCSKVGSTSTYAGKKFTCVKSGKKLVWNKGVKVSIPKDVATPSPTPTADPFASARDTIADPFASAADKAAARGKLAAAITCPVNGKCEIGNTGPGGGIVFYVESTPQSWGQYLEVAPATWNGTSTDPEAPWCGVWNVSLTSAVTDPELKKLIGTEIGKGRGNTQLMTAFCKSGAGNLASAYRGGGKSDWFLPSIDEFKEMYGEFVAGYYWSSSELDRIALNAWRYNFHNKNENAANPNYSTNTKNFTHYVRPVRAFSATPSPTSAANPFAAIAAAFALAPTPDANPFADAAASAAARDKAIADKAAAITCPVNGKCEIGNKGPGGGIVFYVAPTPQFWGQYLEAAPNGWNGTTNDPKANWCDTIFKLELRAADPELLRLIGNGIGKGRGNTQLMTYACESRAAHLASAYRGGGKSDWFLPSKDELHEMHVQLHVNKASNGGFATSAWGSDESYVGPYWSSSWEGLPASDAWLEYFRNPLYLGRYYNQKAGYKLDAAYIRPIRAFS